MPSTTPITVSAMLALVFLALASMTPATEAISCWQCNSQSNKFCKDVTAGPVSNSSNLPSCLQDLYKECPPNGNLTYTFCRKNEQTIKGEKRVIRSCGYDKAETDCYLTKTPMVITHVCQCFEDGCNSAGQTTLGLVTILAALAINRFLLY